MQNELINYLCIKVSDLETKNSPLITSKKDINSCFLVYVTVNNMFL